MRRTPTFKKSINIGGLSNVTRHEQRARMPGRGRPKYNDFLKKVKCGYDALKSESSVREVLKKKVIKLQSVQLLSRMIIGSKMDRVLVKGFSYDGSMKKYLTELNFQEARAIFMSRYRMWPTKENFPGRWSGENCNICGRRDTDEHIFTCPGYTDLINEKFEYDVFWEQECLNDTMRLKAVAGSVIKIIERLEIIQSLNLE